jgi:membrane protease YdiL (CAAX protease family)
MKRPHWISLAEVVAFYGLTLWVIWCGGRFRPTILIVAAIILAISFGSNRFHGDDLERVGLARKNFWPAMKLAFPVTLPFLLPLIFLAFRREGFAAWDWKFSFFGYPIWGFAQEYVLLGFIANRLQDALPERGGIIPWINGALFALVHLPNPLLMSVTFVSGVLFTALFFRRRHLVPFALLHAIFGILINLAFGNIHGVMSVGPNYTRRLGNPYPLVDPRKN